MLTRRSLLATVAATFLAACHRICQPLTLPTPSMGPMIVDAHNHLFNVTDLSAVKFISDVLLHRYPELSKFVPRDMLLAPDEPTFLDRIVAVLLALVGTGSAPSAVTETMLLQGKTPIHGKAGEDKEVIPVETLREITIGQVADLLGNKRINGDAEAEAFVRDTVIAAVKGGGKDISKAGRAERLAIARSALAMADDGAVSGAEARRRLDIAGIFNFIGQLRRFRHCLVEELTMLHRNAGQNPLLLAPAMVDFGRWLRDDPEERSTFVDQVKLWREISIRHSGPAVHGYVAFCPLRQVLYELGQFQPGGTLAQVTCRDNPLEVARDALENNGFLGVKLYPPMGFRPARNAERWAEGLRFPKKILEDAFGKGAAEPPVVEKNSRRLGALLDGALHKLYVLCAKLNAPIMAHGANSNAAYQDSGAFADPGYWKPVFNMPAAPAIMLAHFGGFADRTVGEPQPEDPASTLPADLSGRFRCSWEASVARYVQDNPGKPVFADISMFTELFLYGREPYLTLFRELDRRYPRMKEHLVFGTDWLMLAQHSFAKDFDRGVRDFLKSAFDSDAHVEAIMRNNFLRFSGLTAGSAAHDRITRVYGADPILHERLTALYKQS